MTDLHQLDTAQARDLSALLALWDGAIEDVLTDLRQAETLSDLPTGVHLPLAEIGTDGQTMARAITIAVDEAETFTLSFDSYAFAGFDGGTNSSSDRPATDDEIADLKDQLENFAGTSPFEYDVLWEQYMDAILSRAENGGDIADLVGDVDPDDLAIALRQEHGSDIPSDIALAYLLHNDDFLDQAAGKGDNDDKYSNQDVSAVDRADVTGFEWAIVQALRNSPTLLQEVAAIDNPQRFAPPGESWAFTGDNIETFLEFQSALRVLAEPGNADWIDSIKSGEGIDGYVGDADLDRILDAEIPNELRQAVEFLHDHPDLVTRMAVLPHITSLLNQDGEVIDFEDDLEDLIEIDEDLVDDDDTLWDEHQSDGFTVDGLLAMVVRNQAFASEPEAARLFVEGLDVVLDGGEHHYPVGLFDEEGVQQLANLTLPLAGNLTEAHNLIAHLPETYQGTRNELINGFYNVLAEGVEGWVGGPNAGDPSQPGHPGFSWIQVAPWASLGLRPALTESVDGPFGIPVDLDPDQLAGAADGNQWIFNDVGGPYAALLDLLDEYPEPTTDQWQGFFDDNFDPGDATLRNGFVALVAAVNEADPRAAQELMFQSNILLATHEQLGVQPYLVDVGTVIHPSVDPNGYLSSFIQLGIGDLQINVTDSVPFPDSQPPNHLFWGADPVDLDPGHLDPENLSTDGFIFSSNPDDAGQPGVIVVPDIGGVEVRFEGLDGSIGEWVHDGQGTRPLDDGPGTQFFGTDAGDWNNVDERMWFLTTLFYVTQFNPALGDTPPAAQIENVSWLDDDAVPGP